MWNSFRGHTTAHNTTRASFCYLKFSRIRRHRTQDDAQRARSKAPAAGRPGSNRAQSISSSSPPSSTRRASGVRDSSTSLAKASASTAAASAQLPREASSRLPSSGSPEGSGPKASSISPSSRARAPPTTPGSCHRLSRLSPLCLHNDLRHP